MLFIIFVLLLVVDETHLEVLTWSGEKKSREVFNVGSLVLQMEGLEVIVRKMVKAS